MARRAYAQVLLDIANRRLDRVYTYLIPPEMPLEPGMTVLVPLQNRHVQGLVARLTDEPPEEAAGKSLRPVLKILERECLLPPDLLALADWLAETTVCSMAQSLHTVWPFLHGKIEKWLIPCEQSAEGSSEAGAETWQESHPEAWAAWQTLRRARRGGLPLRDLGQRLSKQGIERPVAEVAAELVELRAARWEPRFSGSAARRSEERQTEPPWPSPAHLFETLSASQQEVAAEILTSVTAGRGETLLLHGVTGSGKTEVYRQIVAEVVARGGSVILLAPEISLTSQLAQRFLGDFGQGVAVVHSGLSPAEKQRIWQEILAGNKRLVIGARSAVFAPLPNLRLIILDEEHDSAYQQDENPKYHARDVARQRAQQSAATVLLGSATPSLEAYAAAKRGVVHLLELRERFNRRSLPGVEIVDMKQELSQGNKSVFSASLAQKIEQRLARGEQSILFLNRRGYATYVFCRECGYVATCPHCDVALTYHSQRQALRCHYCNHQAEVSQHCPQCGSIYLRFFGQGTQRLEEETQARFPQARVLRLDTDTTAGRRSPDIIEAFYRQEADILVGTQMLAKGFDFPEVTLVGVMLADQLLNRPDFRARERAFQLLTQVAGRAGRRQKKGEVVLQTYTPADRALLYAADHDYHGFFREEITFRRKLGYPPFAHLLRLTVLHDREAYAIRAAQELAAAVRRHGEAMAPEGYQIMGPAPALPPKLKKMYRWQLLIKGKQPATLRRVAHQGVREFYQQPGGTTAGIKLNIEVDPLR